MFQQGKYLMWKFLKQKTTYLESLLFEICAQTKQDTSVGSRFFLHSLCKTLTIICLSFCSYMYTDKKCNKYGDVYTQHNSTQQWRVCVTRNTGYLNFLRVSERNKCCYTRTLWGYRWQSKCCRSDIWLYVWKFVTEICGN